MDLDEDTVPGISTVDYRTEFQFERRRHAGRGAYSLVQFPEVRCLCRIRH